jgi:hypothetical protein
LIFDCFAIGDFRLVIENPARPRSTVRPVPVGASTARPVPAWGGRQATTRKAANCRALKECPIVLNPKITDRKAIKIEIQNHQWQ